MNIIQHSLSKFTFKPLEKTDLELLCNWFEKPHVLNWWLDRFSRDEIKEKYNQRIGDPITRAFIVYLEHKPIGFIQYYWASKVGGGWWPNEDDRTVGTDQFIGEEAYIGKGYGTSMMQAFVAILFQNPVIHKVITEADPENKAAINCYLKAGFKSRGFIDTPDGKSLIFEINNARNEHDYNI